MCSLEGFYLCDWVELNMGFSTGCNPLKPTSPVSREELEKGPLYSCISVMRLKVSLKRSAPSFSLGMFFFEPAVRFYWFKEEPS